MTASVTGSPRYFSASVRSFLRIMAEISCGMYLFPSMSMLQSLPICLLMEVIVLSLLTTAWFWAVCPTSLAPSLVNETTLGVVLFPYSLGMMTGLPFSMTATQLLVVPRSIPIDLPICSLRVSCSNNRPAIVSLKRMRTSTPDSGTG